MNFKDKDKMGTGSKDPDRIRNYKLRIRMATKSRIPRIRIHKTLTPKLADSLYMLTWRPLRSVGRRAPPWWRDSGRAEGVWPAGGPARP